MKRVIMLNDDVNSAQSDEVEAFDQENYNESYKHFIELGQEKGVDIIIANVNDYIGDGKVATAWTREKSVWRKTGKETIEFMYDKFPANNPETQAIKEEIISLDIGILNSPEIEISCKNKLINYQKFSDIIIPTFYLGHHAEDAVKRIEALREGGFFTKSDDFDEDKLIIKPTKGFGGKGIHVIEGNKYDILEEIPVNQYIVQSFLETSEGIPELNINGRHDFRVIISNGEIKQAYVRLNVKDSYVSNQQAGGSLEYISIDDVPDNIREKVNEVDEAWSQIHPRIYSLDFGRGRSGEYHGFEMNGKPGQVWDGQNLIDVKKTKELQEIILDCLYSAR